jgi:uncharacterized damage-inducible protein DinB
MPPQTMSEKDAYAATFEKEYQTTLRVLRAFPKEKIGFTPHERSKSAKELGWMLVLNQQVVEPVLRGDLKPGSFPSAPNTWPELLQAFETAHRDTVGKIAKVDAGVLDQSVKIPSGPGKVGDIRRGDALWFFLHDTIHHRGQFSVYLRMVGGKVPSIYGPTADEPWF